MSEFKGSKGPWVISDSIEKWNRIVDANGDLVTTCYAMQNEDDANANLIAAAPELLEALQEILALYEHDEGCREITEYKRAKAAISKALVQ